MNRVDRVPVGVIAEIHAERRRQIEREGWSARHDDRHHGCGELAGAAACYAVPELKDHLWPWQDNDWKPKERRRDLIRAAALIVAEIERLDRATTA